MNLYAYVQNNPLRFVDPTGHSATFPDMWVPTGADGWNEIYNMMMYHFLGIDPPGLGIESNDAGGEEQQDPQNTGVPQTPCHIMADVAQNIANAAIAYAHSIFEGKKGVGYDGLETNKAIRDFDDLFSYTYHGGPLRTLSDAWRWRGGTGRHINPTFPYIGGAGFRSDFKDSGTETYGGPDADQTHHFSAYLSLGINALWPVKKYHERGDNTGDQNLGRAAYYLGEQIRKGNFQLKDIGQYIRTSICSKPGRGLY